MKKTVIAFTIFSLVFLGGAEMAQGAGFLIYEHGAAAQALGGAFVAVADNPSAIWHNPAGIAWLTGTQMSMGATFIVPVSTLTFTNHPTVNSVDQENQLFYPPSFYITQAISDKITAGFGFVAPYGLGAKWPTDFPLKYIAVKNDMKTFFFNPSLAFLLTDKFSIGIGVSYIHSTLSYDLVEFEELNLGPLLGYPFPVLTDLELPVNLEAKGNAWGLNAGALYRGEGWAIGFNWRGGFKITYEGDLNLGSPQLTPQVVPPDVIAGVIPSTGKASTEFNFPHILGAGMCFNLSRDWMVSVDAHYTLWSSFEEYVVDVDVPLPVPGIEFKDKEVYQDWKNSWTIRAGVQYMASEALALRAGIIWDDTPQPISAMDPAIPDSDRWAFTAGLGYRIGKFVVDLCYQYEPFEKRTSPNRNALIHPVLGNIGEGEYATTAHLFGISLGFLF
jgi:long-chain fatty acid transport protein